MGGGRDKTERAAGEKTRGGRRAPRRCCAGRRRPCCAGRRRSCRSAGARPPSRASCSRGSAPPSRSSASCGSGPRATPPAPTTTAGPTSRQTRRRSTRTRPRRRPSAPPRPRRRRRRRRSPPWPRPRSASSAWRRRRPSARERRERRGVTPRERRRRPRGARAGARNGARPRARAIRRRTLSSTFLSDIDSGGHSKSHSETSETRLTMAFTCESVSTMKKTSPRCGYVAGTPIVTGSPAMLSCTRSPPSPSGTAPPTATPDSDVLNSPISRSTASSIAQCDGANPPTRCAPGAGTGIRAAKRGPRRAAASERRRTVCLSRPSGRVGVLEAALRSVSAPLRPALRRSMAVCALRRHDEGPP